MELNIRTAWETLTLNEYLEYQEILQASGTTEFTKQLEVLALLANVPSDSIRTLPAREITQAFQHLEFLTEEPKLVGIRKEYLIGNKRYRLYDRIEEITAGQFLDLSNYCQEPYPKILLANTANILATLLLPIVPEEDIAGNGIVARRKVPLTEKYLQTPRHETVQNVLNEFPVTEALSIAGFFIVLLLSYTAVTKKYSEEQQAQSKLI